jgi:flagellin
MASIINTNPPSLGAQRFLNSNQVGLQGAMQKLSSGQRINSAKDDAAGLAIAIRMLGEIQGSNQAVRNANDGVSLAQVAEGGMQEIEGNLLRMRELAVQSANGIYSDADRAAIQKEFSSLQEEIGRVAQSTEFNGVKVLSSNQSLEFQVGADDGGENRIDVTAQDITDAATGIGDTLDSATTSVGTQTGARSALDSIDSALASLSGFRADYGAVQNRFESSVRNLQIGTENQEAAKSRIMDTDYARQSAELTRRQILNQSGMAMLSQANANPQMVLSLLGG